MPRVDVVNVEEGVVLASDVINFNGQLLLPKETKISEKHINLLKTWGIQQIEIVESGDGDEGPLLSALSEGDLQILNGQLKGFFRDREKSNPWMAHLFQLCLERKARTLKT